MSRNSSSSCLENSSDVKAGRYVGSFAPIFICRVVMVANLDPSSFDGMLESVSMSISIELISSESRTPYTIAVGVSFITRVSNRCDLNRAAGKVVGGGVSRLRKGAEDIVSSVSSRSSR